MADRDHSGSAPPCAPETTTTTADQFHAILDKLEVLRRPRPNSRVTSRQIAGGLHIQAHFQSPSKRCPATRV